MVQTEYKQLSCRDLGEDCDFLVRAEKEDEVMSVVTEHRCRAHGRCEITPELKDKMRLSMRNVCCAGQCYDAPRITRYSCWDAS
jgi:predicted small metal-binding protein